jgi:chemotaxis protein methyltransferase CheR
MNGLIAEIKDLTREDYDKIRALVYEKSGINLGEHKMQLVRARLGKRVRQGGFKSFTEYFKFVEEDPSGEQLSQLLDSISTNTTHLFREIRHFELLASLLSQWMEDRSWRASNNSIRIWSSASSSGEEPYSVAMVAHDVLQHYPGVELKILATDISTRMLDLARQGIFDASRVDSVPPKYRNRYLQRIERDGEPYMQIAPELKQLIKFGRFNLMTPQFPFRRGFHIIFCRNVMIYFDRPTQQNLVQKLSQHLLKGGYLLIGHSESLNNLSHSMAYIEPTVYRK